MWVGGPDAVDEMSTNIVFRTIRLLNSKIYAKWKETLESLEKTMGKHDYRFQPLFRGLVLSGGSDFR